MGIPTAYKISPSGVEDGSLTFFRAPLVYRIPQDEVETYRSDFTPGLDTGGVTGTASNVSSAGKVTSTTGLFSTSHVGNPITIGTAGTFYIESYTSTRTVDTSYTHTTAVTSKDLTIQSSKTYPGKSGILAPRLDHYRLEAQYPGVPGHSRLTMWYQTPRMEQLVEESTGRATIEMDTMGIAEKMTKEVDAVGGKFIEGQDWSSVTKLQEEWRVTKGSNVSWRPGITQFIIKAASTAANVDDLQDMVGKVNDRELPNFGSPGTGTLMFLGARLQNRIPVSNLWMTHHYFARDPGEMSGSTYTRKPWHCRSALRESTIMEVPVRDTAGVVDTGGEVAKMVVLIPVMSGSVIGTRGASADRIVHRGSANFMAFNTKLEWLNEL